MALLLALRTALRGSPYREPATVDVEEAPASEREKLRARVRDSLAALARARGSRDARGQGWAVRLSEEECARLRARALPDFSLAAVTAVGLVVIILGVLAFSRAMR